MKKLYFVFVTMIVVAMQMIACGNKQETKNQQKDTESVQQLQELVEEMNKTCPLPLGEYLRIDGFDYADDVVRMYFSVSSNFFKMSDVHSNKETFRRNLLIGMANDKNASFKEMVDLFASAGAELCIVFCTTDDDDDCVEFYYEADELNEAFIKSNNDCEVLLQAMADNAELQTPQKIEEGLIMTDVYIKDKCFTYEYSCDENMYDIDALKQSKEILKEAILQELKSDDPIYVQLRKRIKECNYRMAYKYVGDASGESLMIIINSDEL